MSRIGYGHQGIDVFVRDERSPWILLLRNAVLGEDVLGDVRYPWIQRTARPVDGELQELEISFDAARANGTSGDITAAACAGIEIQPNLRQRVDAGIVAEPPQQRDCPPLHVVAVFGLIRRTAAQLGQLDQRTLAGVLATAYSHTHFLDSSLLATAMRETTVRFADDSRPMTAYLIVPPVRTKVARRYCRLVVGTFLREVTANFDRSGPRWLALLDEVQNLGRLDPIEDEFTIAAGAGVRFWLIAQDIAGLRRAYPKSWESFVSNADITMLFGINDFGTADLVSKLTGDATVRVSSENRSAGVSYGRGGASQEGASASISEHGRRLLFPDEARRLRRDEVIIFPRGAAPIRARRLDYRTDPDFAPLLRGRRGAA